MNPLKRTSSTDKHVSPPPLKRKQLPSTTTQKAVSNFFKPASQKEPDKITWRVVNDSLLIGKYNASAVESKDASLEKKKIAAFDFDSTLITTQSGNTFSRNGSDWKWWHTSVPNTLKRLHSEGYMVAIVSNQSGISLKPNPKSLKSDMKRLSDFKEKANAVFNQLDLPISLYAATAKDQYRKPRPGMWNALLEDFALTWNAVDHDESIFVGDAAGREGSVGRKKDFSSSDRDLAANVGIHFKTPEEFFLGEAPQTFVREFDPAAFLAQQVISTPPVVYAKANDVDLVIYCGSPACGKSTFYWKHLKPLGYERVNQDILKSRDRCIKTASGHLANGKSVLIDNTNASREARAHWTTLAAKHKVPIRCIYFTANDKLCRHNDAVRALNAAIFNQDLGKTLNPEDRTILPSVAFTSYRARFEEPKLNEGFTDIMKVDFEFDGTEEQKTVWSKYWI
ncbi:PNK3P-domain-containing protein [Venturia nashicola]|nr:PNK3P-domain-containing protein [Venturia nashicola]